MVILSSDEQPENAELPMIFTLSGIAMLVRSVQPEKAPPAIPRVPFLITIEVSLGIVPLYL